MPSAVEVLTVALALVGVYYARSAARWAKKTFDWQVAGEKVTEERHVEAERRYLSGLQPRPLITGVQGAGGDGLRVTYGNPGGAALVWHAYLQHNDHLYFLRLAAVPAGYISPPSSHLVVRNSQRLPASAPSAPKDTVRTVCSVAEDVDGNFWDCITGKQLTVALNTHIDESLKAAGVQPGR